jgi:primosomal protein N' (replication factor Y)
MLPGLRAAVDDARVKAAATRRRKAADWEPAAADPIARVMVDLPLAHLDRPFDYAVPAAMADTALPGVRVKVRFAGHDVDGFVVERADTTSHTGRLQPLRRLVSPEPVLAPQVAALVRAVADHYAGTTADVLRLAVPPRHAATEKAATLPVEPASTSEIDLTAWDHTTHAAAFLARVAGGGAPRAVWGAAPGDDWARMVAQMTAVAHRAGRGVLVCVPDGRDVRRVGLAVAAVLGAGQHVELLAESGPSARYRDFLAVSRGSRRIVVGTRSAVFAPVRDLGLVVLWDDGDDLHAEPRAPYPHAREVLVMRAAREECAMVIGGFTRTQEAHQLLASGWAHELAVPRDELRRRARIEVVAASDRAVSTRIPERAYEAIRIGLRSGPVLVQTPRAGYAPSLSCERCRTPARCRACSGPLHLPGPTQAPRCRWCDEPAEAWSCPECHHRGLRFPVRGQARTAEELGRMFPGTTIRSSSGERVLDTVDDSLAIVVATPGAEPVAPDGYTAVVILDTWLTLERDDMRASEEALRRWTGAASLVRPGGHVVAVGEPSVPSLQALVRWDPAGLAEREWAERAAAHLPPVARIATISGTPGAVGDALTVLTLPETAEVLGPAPEGDGVRVVLRVPRSLGDVLVASLRELQQVRSARKLEPIRVQVDPMSL